MSHPSRLRTHTTLGPTLFSTRYTQPTWSFSLTAIFTLKSFPLQRVRWSMKRRASPQESWHLLHAQMRRLNRGLLSMKERRRVLMVIGDATSAYCEGADSISPINWASLALGVFDRFTRKLPRQKIDSDAVKFHPSMELKSFAFVYPIMLRVAILSRLRGSEESKMAALLDWMYHSWQFSVAATIFAMQMFSSNRPKGAFKNAGSEERQLILAGVENTTWDLVYVTEWFTRIKRQAEENELSVICSRDSSLITTAELLRQSMFENREPSFLIDGFGKNVRDTRRAECDGKRHQACARAVAQELRRLQKEARCRPGERACRRKGLR